jgi:hypothetical protein
MSECMTCKFALYDGMCLAKGKFTVLDAPACEDYRPRIDVEVSKLKAENAKLRELVRTIYMCSNIRCNQCEYGHGNTCAFDAEAELRKLGIEVG